MMKVFLKPRLEFTIEKRKGDMRFLSEKRKKKKNHNHYNRLKHIHAPWILFLSN